MKKFQITGNIRRSYTSGITYYPTEDGRIDICDDLDCIALYDTREFAELMLIPFIDYLKEESETWTDPEELIISWNIEEVEIEDDEEEEREIPTLDAESIEMLRYADFNFQIASTCDYEQAYHYYMSGVIYYKCAKIHWGNDQDIADYYFADRDRSDTFNKVYKIINNL